MLSKAQLPAGLRKLPAVKARVCIGMVECVESLTTTWKRRVGFDAFRVKWKEMVVVSAEMLKAGAESPSIQLYGGTPPAAVQLTPASRSGCTVELGPQVMVTGLAVPVMV